MEPVPAGLIVQVTAVFDEPVTAAVNCCVWFAARLLAPGVTTTLTAVAGFNETLALADLFESAALVAVRVTVCAAGMEAGAVYSPDDVTEPVPTGLTVQVTAVFDEPVTMAVNCCVWLTARLLLPGVTTTLTTGAVGVNETLAAADWVVSATLVAVTVTVCAVVIE